LSITPNLFLLNNIIPSPPNAFSRIQSKHKQANYSYNEGQELIFKNLL